LLDEITPMNPHIERRGQHWAYAGEVDLGKTEFWSSIAEARSNAEKLFGQFPQAEVIQRDFDTAAAQCNYGLSQVESEWVLSLDAD